MSKEKPYNPIGWDSEVKNNPERIEDIPIDVINRKPTEILTLGELLQRKLTTEEVRLAARKSRLAKLYTERDTLNDASSHEAKSLIKEAASVEQDIAATESIISQLEQQIGSTPTESKLSPTPLEVPRTHKDTELKPSTAELLRSALLTLDVREKRLTNVIKQLKNLEGDTTNPEYLALTREIKDLEEIRIPEAIDRVKELDSKFDKELLATSN